MRTTVLLEHEPTAAGQLVRAMLKLAGDSPPAASRAPLNLSLVLDRSGSMGGAKLEAAREAAALLVRRLGLQDVVSVVAYDDEVTVIAEPAAGAAEHGLAARIAGIHSGGMTNLSGGWLLGREFVKARLNADGVNRVILLTDGLANVGITDHASWWACAWPPRQKGAASRWASRATPPTCFPSCWSGVEPLQVRQPTPRTVPRGRRTSNPFPQLLRSQQQSGRTVHTARAAERLAKHRSMECADHI